MLNREDEEELEKENIKNVSTRKITLSATKSKPAIGEVIGVFESIQPSNTDLGSKAPKNVKIQGVWYGQLDSQSPCLPFFWLNFAVILKVHKLLMIKLKNGIGILLVH